jgi:t-SNARE complex subunit (syntaxin)
MSNITESTKKLSSVNIYPLKNGVMDVYLRKNFSTYEDEEGNTVHTCEEKHIQLSQDITIQDIEDNFESYWNETKELEITDKERIEALENAINALLGL